MDRADGFRGLYQVQTVSVKKLVTYKIYLRREPLGNHLALSRRRSKASSPTISDLKATHDGFARCREAFAPRTKGMSLESRLN